MVSEGRNKKHPLTRQVKFFVVWHRLQTNLLACALGITPTKYALRLSSSPTNLFSLQPDREYPVWPVTRLKAPHYQLGYTGCLVSPYPLDRICLMVSQAHLLCQFTVQSYL